MGGGGGGDPGADARRQEAERQARITAATEQINRIFNNEVARTGQRYTQIGSTPQIPVDASPGQRAMALASAAQPTGVTLTPQQYATKRNTAGFNPGQWKLEDYTYYVPGDPANSRQRMYDQQRTAVYDLNRMDVDRQAAEAERNNRFGLARAGLLGGSVNVDSIGDLDRRTNEGLMRAGGIADQASADLFAADEKTRANLISLAQSGIDTGTAAQQALQGLSVNAANAAGARAGATVGDLFGSMSQAYLLGQQYKGMQSGMNPNQNQQWFGVSSPHKGDAGSVTR